MTLDVKNEIMNITEILSEVSGTSVLWTRIFSSESSEHPQRSLGGHS